MAQMKKMISSLCVDQMYDHKLRWLVYFNSKLINLIVNDYYAALTQLDAWVNS